MFALNIFPSGVFRVCPILCVGDRLDVPMWVRRATFAPGIAVISSRKPGPRFWRRRWPSAPTLGTHDQCGCEGLPSHREGLSMGRRRVPRASEWPKPVAGRFTLEIKLSRPNHGPRAPARDLFFCVAVSKKVRSCSRQNFKKVAPIFFISPFCQ